MSIQKSERNLDEEKYSEKFTTYSLIHSIFFLVVSNNILTPIKIKIQGVQAYSTSI